MAEAPQGHGGALAHINVIDLTRDEYAVDPG